MAPKLPHGLVYGGDYNPEQWPETVWPEDARLMRKARVNLVCVGIFSWAKLEPEPGIYTFDWLHRVLDLLWENGVSVCLATATASPPAWLARRNPESLPVDVAGVRLSLGSRQHYCPNSEAYREAGARLSGNLAQAFGNHPAVALWHLNNEIGCHVAECYCEVCAAKFRTWLVKRYGSLDALNESWGTSFWSQWYSRWDDIQPPRKMPTIRNPGHALDYQRFMSHSLREILTGEADAVRRLVPTAAVTTNGVGFLRPTDYFDWYRSMDIAAWDSYPDPAGGLAEIRVAAFGHDLFRSLKGGQPFLLMEQVPSQVNWRPTNVLKAPGQMRALSYQALARGADGIMFFQWRASRAGAEKFHGAMVPHVGASGRVYGEVSLLGAELAKLAEIAGSRVPAQVAMIMGWENRWALELDSKPAQFDYPGILQHFYGALWSGNIAVDLVTPGTALSRYKVVVAPALYQLTKDQAEILRAFVQGGGVLIMSYFSGIVDDREHIWLGGYPALLQDVLGLAVEEWQPLQPGEHAEVLLSGGKRRLTCAKFTESLHVGNAEVLASYTGGFCQGKAAVTRNRFGAGYAYYFGTEVESKWLAEVLLDACANSGITSPLKSVAGVELSVRRHASAEYLFAINHSGSPARVDFSPWPGHDLLSGKNCDGPEELEQFGVRIVPRPLSRPEC